MNSQSTISRRDLFRGKSTPDTRLRPPWTNSEKLKACTSCGDCISACPEQILRVDPQGKPFIDFSESGCVFCGECAAVCEADVFDLSIQPPWQAHVSLDDTCLLKTGVTCQACTDHCSDDALRFDMSARPVGRLDVDLDACTGCGFCVSTCPVGAIKVSAQSGVSA